VETNFLVKFTLGEDINVSYVTVPVAATVKIPNIGGDPNAYFVNLPKQNWSQFFDDKIRV
jgi:hypothetical protein